MVSSRVILAVYIFVNLAPLAESWHLGMCHQVEDKVKTKLLYHLENVTSCSLCSAVIFRVLCTLRWGRDATNLRSDIKPEFWNHRFSHCSNVIDSCHWGYCDMYPHSVQSGLLSGGNHEPNFINTQIILCSSHTSLQHTHNPNLLRL